MKITKLVPGWRAFEEDIGLLVRAFGYVEEVTRASGDYGVDVVGTKGGKRVAIQCKFFRDTLVGHPVLIQLRGGMAYYGADEGICVTTGRFTKTALACAKKLGLYCIDRSDLLRLCNEGGITLPSLTRLRLGRSLVHPPNGSAVKIGRAVSEGILLQGELISREHCEVSRTDHEMWIRDLGSTNGTIVNGKKISEKTLLRYGDEIQIGSLSGTVELVSPLQRQ